MSESHLLPDGDQVGLNDRNVQIVTFDRYKGVAGKTDRISIVSAKIFRAYVYFYSNKLFRAPRDQDLLRLCREKLGEPQQRFGLVVFTYSTNDDGDLLEPTKLQGKVRLWGWTEAKYEEYSALQRQWPVLDEGFDKKQHDFLSKCEDSKWQRMKTTICPDAHWKKKQAWYDAIKRRAKQAEDKMSIVIGRHLERDEILAMFGAAPVVAPTAAVDIDLSDVLDEEVPTRAPSREMAADVLDDDIPF